MADATTVPIRSNGETIEASWFNTIRTFLIDGFTGIVSQTTSTIVNNSTTAVAELIFDATDTIAGQVSVYVMRDSDTDPKVITTSRLLFNYDGTNWNIIETDLLGPETGVTFSITQGNTVGQISYTSTNYDNTGYTSRFDFRSEQFRA